MQFKSVRAGLLAAASMTIAWGAPALASETGEEAPPAGELIDAIVVLGAREDPLRIGGSVRTLDQDDLDRFAFSDVNRVLRQVPGVFLQEEDGFGLRPNIGIRGSGTDRSSRIAIMEDGILAGAAPYSAPAAYYFPRMARMAGIEVAKGPAAIKYGPSTIGGAVSFFSTPISNAETGTPSGRGTVLAGNHGGARVHGQVGGWTGIGGGLEIGASLEGLYEQSDGFKRIDSGGPTGFAIHDTVAKLGLRTSDGRHGLEFKFQTYDERSDETYLGLTLADFAASPYRRYNASQRDVMNVSHSTYQLTHRSAIGSALDLTTVAYRTDTARSWYKLNDVRNAANTGWTSMATVLENPAANPVLLADLIGAPGFIGRAGALRVRDNNRVYQSTGIQSVLGADFATGLIGHRLDVSARYHEDSESRLQQDDRYRMVNGRMVLTSAGARGTQDNRQGNASAWAFFVQDRITAGPLTVTPGLRYETIGLTQTRWALGDVARATRTAQTRRRVDVFIPGIGAALEVTDGVAIVGGAHRGFAAPAPGSTIDPETSWNYEAGVRLADGGLTLEAIGFVNDYGNLVGTCTASTGATCELGDQFSGGRADARGIELLGRGEIVAGPTIRLPLSLAYTYTRTRFRTSFESSFFGTVTRGDEFPYQPRHQVTATAGLVLGAARIDAQVNHVSAARGLSDQGAITANERIDARTLVDLSGEIGLTPGLSAFATVQNLFDVTYNAAFLPAGARPGAPRLALAGVRARF